MFRMQRVVFLVPLLVAGSIRTLQTDPVKGKSPITALENFHFEQFTGRWYEVAVVSTCPHYMQRKKRNPVMVALELKHVPSQHNFTMTTSTFTNGTCRETWTVLSFTNTPGQFFHHVARFGADVDSFVVDTDYDEYALMMQLSNEKPTGNKTTIVKLYSRTMSVSPPALEKFKELIRHHGMSEDAAIMNQHKGECLPGEPTKEAAAHHQVFGHESSKQIIPAEEEQSDVRPGLENL
ncbi:protein AMBP isoform X2 [Fundulus heteroclitus]|uniref:protein AMBP isoform X2 n=1 Tax=Fundulus heteroclitus TaxID=8078 RepID=UPI00165CDA04|nr:protein AMBP isoform X2 [Fundulus heteroclitus]